MAEDLMRYDELAQNALRGVVREALRRVEKSGLPGEHHFYIAFNTRFPGVTISDKLLQRHAREMTIVLQHQYSNLIVADDHFSVVLYFDQLPEKLVVPYAAIKGFLDPAVKFGLQFDAVPTEQAKLPAKIEETPEAMADSPRDEADTEMRADNPEKEKVVSLDAFRKK
jgi:uncharacterized protein